MFTESHNYLIEDEQKQQVKQLVPDTSKTAGQKFAVIFPLAKKIIEVLLSIPLPKKWKTILSSLILVGEVVANDNAALQQLAESLQKENEQLRAKIAAPELPLQ